MQYNWYPYRKRSQRHTGRMHSRWKQRKNVGSTTLGTPRVAGKLQKQDKMRKDPPLKISQGA